jgi:hypothetical protein
MPGVPIRNNNTSLPRIEVMQSCARSLWRQVRALPKEIEAMNNRRVHAKTTVVKRLTHRRSGKVVSPWG